MVLVIVVFLRSFRASLIPIVTIPISLIATFTLMLIFGFSVNTLTLLAMVLAIGLVVDDAIVVLENIYRHIEDGMKPVAAAIKGTQEIGFAVIAMTLTLTAVYAPIAFASGKTGRLFLEFALTLAGAVLISGFVALTLTPMMCAKLLRHDPNPSRFFLTIERAFMGLENGYRRALGRALNARGVIILIALGVAGSSAFLLTSLKSELAPVEDRGVLRVRGTGPEGATLAYTSRYSAQADKILDDIPEIRSRLIINGNPEVSQFLIFTRFKDWDDRERSQQQVSREIAPQLRRIAGARVFATDPGAFGQRGTVRPIEFVLQSSATYEELQKQADKLLEAIADYPGLASVDTDLKLNTPEFRIEMDRDQGLGSRSRRQCRRQDARDAARRPPGDALRHERRAVRRHRAARDQGPLDAGRPRHDFPARAVGRHGAAVEYRQSGGDGGAQGAQAIQSAALGDDLGQPGAGIRARRSLVVSWRRRPGRCCRRRCRPTSTARAAISAPRARAWRWCS